MLEDEPRDAGLVEHALKDGGFNFSLRRVETEDGFLRELHRFEPNVILSDHGLPAFDGFSALALARTQAPDVPFIFVTGSLGEEMAIKALKSGATDFVLKHHLATLAPAVHRALRQVEFRVQRKRAVEALQSSEERYRSLVELSPDALFVQSTDRMQFLFINTAGVKLFGAKTARDLVGKPVLDFIHPDYREAARARIELVSDEHRPIPFLEQKILRLDGTAVEVEIAAAPMTFEDKAAAQVIVHPIAERKEAEEKIRRLNVELEQRVVERTAELEAANKELEAFSYSVSHDLRAPLRHIEGFVELLTASSGSKLTAEARGYVETIAGAAKQMGRLIDDLLAFSRTARGELQKIKVNLNDLIRETMQEMTQDMAGRRIDLRIAQLPRVEADPNLLRHVFWNLIGNALKYTRTRPEARIEIGDASTPSEVIVFVKDNGVGFDPRYGHKLFGVFQRLHRSADFEGTGIGLANVRRIIHRHGGRTWAEGALDRGATFYFSLPKASGRRSNGALDSWTI